MSTDPKKIGPPNTGPTRVDPTKIGPIQAAPPKGGTTTASPLNVGGSARERVWWWDNGIGNSSLFVVVYLGDTHLYHNQTVLTEGGKNKMVAALEAGGNPDEQFPKAKQRIALTDIRELRFSSRGKALEIYHGPKSPTVLFGKDEPSVIYRSLRQRLAPDVTPREGTLSRASSALAASIGLMLSVVVGGLLTFWAAIADPNPNNLGRRAGMKNGIDVALAEFGVWRTAGVAAAVVAIFALWFAAAFFRPRPAEVVDVTRST
jgi:hypothetical protein